MASGTDMRTSAISRLLIAGVVVAIGLGFGWIGGLDGPAAGQLSVLAWCAVAAFAINLVAFVPSAVFHTERFYDLTGSITYLSMVAIALALAPQRTVLSWLVAAMVAAWTLRLGIYLVTRILRDRGDRRFERMRDDPSQLLVTWALQGLWAIVTAGCALAIIASSDGFRFSGVRGAVVILGAVVWAKGLVIEAVADAQKRAFRSDPANSGRFITGGLWAWSRHPNYFGEIMLWAGIAIIGTVVLRGWALVTLVSPVAVYLLLTRVSGVPILERAGERRWGDEPSYQRYVRDTPVLVPRPPRTH
jgi:steroid 5-alpha reductase family enzyme